MAVGRFSEGRDGWTVAGERHRRGSLIDWTAAASGFRRAGDWTISGAVGMTNHPRFMYRRAFEGELARRVAGTLVLHGGYRYLNFPHVNVRILQPAASVYFPRGELQARLFFVRNVTNERDTSTVLLRGTWAVRPRLRVGGGGAIGNRIFDVAALPESNGKGRVAFGHATVSVAAAWSLTVAVTHSHEAPSFSQRTLSVGLRRTFP